MDRNELYGVKAKLSSLTLDMLAHGTDDMWTTANAFDLARHRYGDGLGMLVRVLCAYCSLYYRGYAKLWSEGRFTLTPKGEALRDAMLADLKARDTP